MAILRSLKRPILWRVKSGYFFLRNPESDDFKEVMILISVKGGDFKKS